MQECRYRVPEAKYKTGDYSHHCGLEMMQEGVDEAYCHHGALEIEYKNIDVAVVKTFPSAESEGINDISGLEHDRSRPLTGIPKDEQR